jgi:hypothetical protein
MSRFSDNPIRKYDPYWEAALYTQAVLANEAYNKPWMPKRWNYDSQACGDYQYLQDLVCCVRRWKTNKIATHKHVLGALDAFGRPANMHQLVLEIPQVALDGVRVAYARNDQKREAHFADDSGQNKHMTVTTLAKYVTRHWPHVKSDQIRNYCESVIGTYGMAETMDEMLAIMAKTAAVSCMTAHDNEDEIDDEDAPNAQWSIHPYQAYDPKFGWRLAYAKVGDKIVGRALVNVDCKTFVRTYGKEQSDGYTGAHAGLHGWLESQGFEYEDEWPEGVKFAKIPYRGKHLAPYLDPGGERIRDSETSRNVKDCGSYMERCDEGEYKWDNTDGEPDESGVQREVCDDCDGRFDSDDLYYLGELERSVCDGCLHDNYTHAVGRHGRSSYIADDHVVYVDGEPYDSRYISDNDIIELHDGEYCSDDDAVYVDSENEYYRYREVANKPGDRGQVVRVGENYELRDNCQWCFYNDKWILEEDATQVAEDVYVCLDDINDYLMGLDAEDFEAALKCLEYSPEKVEEVTAQWIEASYDAEPAELETKVEPVVTAPPVAQDIEAFTACANQMVMADLHLAETGLLAYQEALLNGLGMNPQELIASLVERPLAQYVTHTQAVPSMGREGTVTGRMSSGLLSALSIRPRGIW